MLVLESAGATALTKGHGRVGRPASLHIGQNPVNLLLNPAKTEAGLTNPRKRDGVEIATPSRQLTGARRRAHTQTKRLTSQSRNGNNSHQTRNRSWRQPSRHVRAGVANGAGFVRAQRRCFFSADSGSRIASVRRRRAAGASSLLSSASASASPARAGLAGQGI